MPKWQNFFKSGHTECWFVRYSVWDNLPIRITFIDYKSSADHLDSNNLYFWAVVGAQLGVRSLPIPEVHGSNPVISKNLFILNIWLLSIVYWKDENKEKRGRGWPFFLKKNNLLGLCIYLGILFALSRCNSSLVCFV